MQIINCTPHPITFVTEQGTITLPPSGIVPRATTRRIAIGEIAIGDGKIPVYRTEFGAVEDLPEPAPDTVWVVSAIVAQAVRRPDVVIVDDTVRDEQGRIIGARAVARVD